MLVLILSSTLSAQDPTVVWREDFEDPAWSDRWSSDFGTWEVGNPEQCAPPVGPGKAHQGASCLGTIICGDYADWVDTRFRRHVSFQVPPANQSPRLRFWHWFSFSTYDHGRVEIRETGGEWQPLSQTYYNWSSVWTRPSLDLSAYAGKQVELGFHFWSADQYSDGWEVSTGWYLDEVEVLTGPRAFLNPEDFEEGPGEWWVTQGVWEVGKPEGGGAHSGEQLAATVLDGNYADWQDSYLVSAPFQVPAAAQSPRLRFWHWFSFSTYDHGRVEIRRLGGAWEPLSPDYGGSSDWTQPFLDLTAYAGAVVELGFHFWSADQYSDGWETSDGWHIDDIQIEPLPEEADFRRGDVNGDLDINISDPIAALAWLFEGGAMLPCQKAADLDDSGGINITDPVYLLRRLFSGGPIPPPPFAECGRDPTPDSLTCGASALCAASP